MTTIRTAAHPLETAPNPPKAKRPERHFRSLSFAWGVLPEDFDASRLDESQGFYHLPVDVADPDPASEGPERWVLTLSASELTPRRMARLRPSAEVLFVANFSEVSRDWFDDPDAVPVDRGFFGPCQVNVVRFAVVTAGRRARTRYGR